MYEFSGRDPNQSWERMKLNFGFEIQGREELYRDKDREKWILIGS